LWRSLLLGFLRELFGVEDGDYVRLGLVEVLKKEDEGWVRRKVG
jgi:hypothetical protein